MEYENNLTLLRKQNQIAKSKLNLNEYRSLRRQVVKELQAVVRVLVLNNANFDVLDIVLARLAVVRNEDILRINLMFNTAICEKIPDYDMTYVLSMDGNEFECFVQKVGLSTDEKVDKLKQMIRGELQQAFRDIV